MKKSKKIIYPVSLSKGKKWSAIAFFIMGNLFYVGLFVYGVINLLKAISSPDLQLFHFSVGGVSIVIFFTISFFYIGSIVKKWGFSWKSFWFALLSAFALIGAVCLMLYGLWLTVNVTQLWLVLLIIIMMVLLPILLLIALFSFLFR